MAGPISRRQLFAFWRRPTLQRPPGAIEEQELVERCLRCGRCAEVCPAEAIFPRADGTPVIDPARMPCVLCDGLLCTHACPSGALQPQFDPQKVRLRAI